MSANSNPRRRQDGESFPAWLVRLAAMICYRASPKDEALAATCPACTICGEAVFLSAAGRLDIRHDYHRHYAHVTTPQAPRPTRPFFSRVFDRDDSARYGGEAA